MSKRIEAKLMKENLKRGWTTKDFCVHLKMSAAEFNDALYNSFTDSVCRDMKSHLVQNEKLQKKLCKTSKDFNINALMTDLKASASQKKIKGEDKKPKEKSLEDLKAEAEKLKSEIASIERSKQELLTKKHDFYLSLASEKEELEKILKTVSTKESIIDGLINNLSSLEAEIKTFKDTITSKEKELEKVSEEITKLTKIVIFFYNDGSFEFDGIKNETSIDSEEISRRVNSFLANDTFEDLTIKQIRGIARLKAILETTIPKYEITFESEVLEKAFKSII